MRTDLHSEIVVQPAIDPAAIYNSNGTKTGAIIDTQGYEALEFALQAGVLTDGTWTSAVYAGNASDMSDEADISATGLIGVTAGPSFAITDDSTVKRVGVNLAKVGKRYYRIKATQAAATTGGYFCGSAILGLPRFMPTSTP